MGEVVAVMLLKWKKTLEPWEGWATVSGSQGKKKTCEKKHQKPWEWRNWIDSQSAGTRWCKEDRREQADLAPAASGQPRTMWTLVWACDGVGEGAGRLGLQRVCLLGTRVRLSGILLTSLWIWKGGLWLQTACTLSLPLTTCVMLGKLLDCYLNSSKSLSLLICIVNLQIIPNLM